MASARAAARAWASGDILARNSPNFLAIDLPFLSQSLKVCVVQLVGYHSPSSSVYSTSHLLGIISPRDYSVKGIFLVTAQSCNVPF
jgi:hypothetical protein